MRVEIRVVDSGNVKPGDRRPHEIPEASADGAASTSLKELSRRCAA